MKQTFSHVLKGVGIWGGCCLCTQGMWAQAERPNIIYVFPDQYRNMAMGFWNDAAYKPYVDFQADRTYAQHQLVCR